MALFAVLTWQVTAGGALVRRDLAVLHWFLRQSAAHPGAGTAAHYLCKLGNVEAAVPVLAAAVAVSAWAGRAAGLPRWWLPPLAGALAMAAVPLVVTVVKDAVHRPAPGATVPDPGGYGWFPSGHTATSAVAFGAAALLVLPWVRRPAARAVLAAGTPLLLLAVGLALVWCDYHWPLDVLASWSLTLTLLSAVAAAQILQRRAAEDADGAPDDTDGTGGVGGAGGAGAPNGPDGTEAADPAGTADPEATADAADAGRAGGSAVGGEAEVDPAV